MKFIAALLLTIAACQRVPAQTLDADGWTVLTPAADSRMIYVSSSAGNDTNDGLTDATPKATIEAGLLLLRNGQPDWLMLKCGDTFTSAVNHRIETQGGISPEQRTVITSYGSGPRPIIKNCGFWYGSGTKPLKHFAIVGLDFHASTNDPASTDYKTIATTNTALQFLVANAAATDSDGWLFENNRFRFFSTQVQINGNLGSTSPTLIKGVRFRRNVVTDGIEFGMLLTNSDGAIVEENTFDRNGWVNRTVQLHNLYATSAKFLTIRNNIFSRGGNMSCKISGNKQSSMTDFTIENNVFHRGMVGFGHGDLDGSWNPLTQYSHERGIVRNNVMMKTGKNVPVSIPTSFQSIGMNIGNAADCVWESNIFAHNDEIQSGGQVFAFADPSIERCRNITLKNNIVWNWLSNWHNNTGSYMMNTAAADSLVEENNLSENTLYNDPSRTLGSYSATIGGAATEDAFLDRAAAMRKGDWDSRYTAAAFNDYMREGFFVVIPEPMPDPIPVPNPEPVPTPTPTIDRILAGLRAAAAAFLEASN